MSKLVACRISELPPLPNNHDSQQVLNLSGALTASERATALELLVADIVAKMKAVGERGVEIRRTKNQLRDPFAPFLINRGRQESAIGDAITELGVSGGARAFIIAGPENECPDEFLDRLRRHSCPKLWNGHSWAQLNVDWPPDASAATFGRQYHRNLAWKLGHSATVEATGLAAALANQDATVAVVSQLAAAKWATDEPARVNAWLAFWRQLAASPARFSAVPILCVRMPTAEPGWSGCPKECSQIWRDAQRLAAVGSGLSMLSFLRKTPASSPPIGAPPLLGPVGSDDAAGWLADQFEDTVSVEWKAAKAEIEQLFKPKAASKHGVPMKAFVEAVGPLFGKSV
jgi:hypothetical protein